MKRTWVIVLLLAIAVAAFVYYLQNRPLEGVETKGPEDIMAWVSLATSMVSMLGSVAGLILKLFDIREKASQG